MRRPHTFEASFVARVSKVLTVARMRNVGCAILSSSQPSSLLKPGLLFASEKSPESYLCRIRHGLHHPRKCRRCLSFVRCSHLKSADIHEDEAGAGAILVNFVTLEASFVVLVSERLAVTRIRKVGRAPMLLNVVTFQASFVSHTSKLQTVARMWQVGCVNVVTHF